MDLYTRRGDMGRSDTLNCRDLPKNSPVFEVLGTLDEATSHLGVVKTAAPTELKPLIEQLQRELLSVCGEIAGGKSFVTDALVAQLESRIDAAMQGLPAWNGFILPGATVCGAQLDVARTVIRRAERAAVPLAESGGISAQMQAFLNRLSDYVYALARRCDAQGHQNV